MLLNDQERDQGWGGIERRGKLNIYPRLLRSMKYVSKKGPCGVFKMNDVRAVLDANLAPCREPVIETRRGNFVNPAPSHLALRKRLNALL